MDIYNECLYRNKELIREMAKNCRNEKYENCKIVCPDGELRLNQLIAFLIIPELSAVGFQAGECVTLLPDVRIQEIHYRIRVFFESVTNLIEEAIQTNEIQTSQFWILQSSAVDRIINEEVLRDIGESETLLFEDQNFADDSPDPCVSGPSLEFQCDQCTQSFRKRFSLKRHRESKHEHQTVECGECGKLISKHNLTNHMKLHRQKEYKCEVCNKEFPRSVDLKIHKRTHSDIRPYQCEVCHKSFHSTVTLKLHMKTHMDRPFICEECDKSFVSLVKLNRHKMSHVDVKNFKCPQAECKSTFGRIDNLKKHMRSQHDVRLPDYRSFKQ